MTSYDSTERASAGKQTERTSTPALFELFELAPRLHRLLDAHFRSLQPALTFGQYRTLRRVGEGYDTLTAIWQAGTLSLPALSERLDGLVRKRLIRRRADRNDRRSVKLSLTPDGRRVLAEGQLLMAQLSDGMLAELSPDEATELVRAVHVLAGMVTSTLPNDADPAVDN